MTTLFAATRTSPSRMTLALACAAAFGTACAKNTSDGPSAPSSAPPADSATASAPASETIATSAGALRVTPLHHATLLFEFGGKAIYLDPVHDASFAGLPRADVIFITDIHPDHLDAQALESIRKPTTIVVVPKAVAEKLPATVVSTGIIVMKNGDTQAVAGFKVDAIPMYNLKRGPTPDTLFHDNGRGNGYVFTFGDKRVYVSGDTECTPEMRALKKIDVAFVCMNLPYTMPPKEAAECIKAFRPAIVYPYHFKDSNLDELKSALAGEAGIEVRVRKWY